ncbi:MAG: lipase family alpha/beta hydrolase [Sandaracinaceae bacterium]
MLAWIGLGLGFVALSLLASWLHYVYWTRRFTLDLEYASEEVIPTADGVHVVLRRMPTPDGVEVCGAPVLLVHGLALNHRNHDMTEDLSLGRHLARAGRDVWLLTLRSGREDLVWAEERAVTFEKMAENDVPTGIDAVLERTGANALDYVGFSMGGMLMYACHGQTVRADKLRRVVIIGSPAAIVPPLVLLSRVARVVPGWLVPTLRLRLVSRFVAFASEIVKTPLHHWLYNPDNVDRGLAAYCLVNGFVNIPSGLANEFVRWAGDEGAVRYGEREVTDSLRDAATPVLFFAGMADNLAPHAAVELAYDAWGASLPSVDKELIRVGIDYGAAADYGHGDLAIGRHAELDVFDPLEAWLGTPR